MTRLQIEAIAARAAQLAVSGPDAVDFTEQEYYKEYLDQLQTGDTTWLRCWIGQEVEEGCLEAVEILKMWIKAELRVAA